MWWEVSRVEGWQGRHEQVSATTKALGTHIIPVSTNFACNSHAQPTNPINCWIASSTSHCNTQSSNAAAPLITR